MSTAEQPLEIGARQLRAWLEEPSPPLVVDVREPWEVAICALPGSLNVPLGQLPQRVGDLPGDRPLVLLCHHGMRSMKATMWLRQRGFALASNLEAGIDGWARQVDPAMPTY